MHKIRLAMCWLVCGFVYMSVGAHGDQKRASDPLELELPAVVSCLKIKAGASAREAHFPAPMKYCLNIKTSYLGKNIDMGARQPGLRSRCCLISCEQFYLLILTFLVSRVLTTLPRRVAVRTEPMHTSPMLRAICLSCFP